MLRPSSSLDPCAYEGGAVHGVVREDMLSIADIAQVLFIVIGAAFLFELFTTQKDLPFSFVVVVISAIVLKRANRWPFRRKDV